MKLSQIEVNKLSREQITRVLFGKEKDDGSKGDCIFTYGGRGIERVAKAVDLYRQKRANYILFTGGLKYGKYTYPEAAMMRDNALKRNIPKQAIITEENSNNTKENAIASLSILDRKFGIDSVKNLLVISIPWHYRRAILSIKTYYPEWIDCTWCPANYEQHQPDNWWKYPESHGYVMKEITNLVKFVREGQLMDIEVEI